MGKKPKYGIIYNVLYRIGIYLNVEARRVENVQRFKNLDEAFKHYSRTLCLENRDQKEIVRSFLKERLRKEDGHLTMRGNSDYVRTWWDKSILC